jgi:nucleoid-associated protein YgaU
VNETTGDRFVMESYTKLSFTPDNNLREIINRPFEHFDTVLLNDGVSFDDVEVVDETPAAAAESVEEAAAAAEEAVAAEETPADVVEEAASEESPAEQPAEEIPAEQPAEQLAEQPEDDPLQRMIAEAVEQKRKREAIVSDIYSKREETPTAPPPVAERQRRKRNYMKYVVNGMLIVVFAAIFGCGFMVLKMYFPEIFATDNADNTVEADKMAMDFQQIVLSDTTIVTSDDTLAAPEPQDTAYLYDSAAMVAIDALENMESASKMKDSKEIKPVAVKEIKAEPAKATSLSAHNKAVQAETAVNNTPVHPDSVTYKIKGTKATHTLQPGETLTRVSLKYYGTKDLYPYIVKYNSDVIKNPNNVPIGTTLKIPELVKK